MRVGIRRWLLKRLNAKNTLDAVVVAVELAASDKGDKKVAKELRRMADSLERRAIFAVGIFPHRRR